MSITRHNLILRSLLVLALILGLSGCSVRYDKKGKILFNTDLASVLGNEVGQFTLAEGPEINASADKLQLNFTTGNRVEQFNWQHGEVYHRRFPVQKQKTVVSNSNDNVRTSRKTKAQPVAKPVKRTPTKTVEPLPPKVAQPELNNSVPTEIYAPTKTRQTSLELKS